MGPRAVRLVAILQLVLRRARTRPGRGLLVAAGIAIACALVAGLAGGSLAARDRALQKTVAALPQSDRSVRVGWSGTSPGTTFPALDRGARRALRPLGGRVARSVAFRSLHIGSGLVQIAAVDSLAQVVRLSSGRLPRMCTPTRCEVVALSGHPAARSDAAGIHLRVVGRGTMTSALPLGDVLVHEPGMPAVPVVVTSGVRTLTALPALSALFRGYSWAVALRPSSLHVWNTTAVLGQIARGESDLQLQDSAFGVTAPVDDVLAARDSGRAAARRILLVGGEAAALVLAFAVLAAAGLRRDVEAERRRLEHHGASRSQSALLALAESCLTAFLGTLAGLLVGVAAIAVVARETGLPAAALTRHALGSPLALALVAACGLAAAGLVAGRLLVAEADERQRARVGALDVAAIASALAVVLALVRGPATADELQGGQGAGILLLALPALVALSTGVLLARVLGPVTRLAERAGRGASAAPRLALLALARGRGRTSATAAFLAVSIGLALFAAVYGATLSEGDRDQAAFQVPLDFTAAQGTSLTRPLAAAPLATWQGIAPGALALPVSRLPAAVVLRNGSFVSPDLIGLPAAGLPRLHSIARAGLDPSPATVAGRLAPDPVSLNGLRLPPGARSLSIAGTRTGVPIELTLTIATRGSDIALVSLRQAGSSFRGTLPANAVGGLVIGLQVDPPEGNAKGDAHQAAEGVQGSASERGRAVLGPLEADGKPITGLQRFVGRGRVQLRAHGDGVALGYTLDGSTRSYIRPREPFDTRALPVLASPDVARSAGPGGLLSVQVDGVNVRARVVATASRFPTETDAPFLVADQRSLSVALAADSPADSLPSELWLGVPAASATRAASALRHAPFSALTISSRRTVERSLQDDPLARGLVLALAAGAVLALLLALAGLLLAVTSDLRDEKGTLADLEAQGLAPADLRLHMRLRAAMLVVAGVVGGVGVGAALVAAVHDALLTAATIGDPVPPLQTAVPWLLLGVGVLALATVCVLAVEGPVRLALRGASPRRQAGGGW
ncbi:MAG TPA: FtsX-like permease family protein [Gaiellales bacterium]